MFDQERGSGSCWRGMLLFASGVSEVARGSSIPAVLIGDSGRGGRFSPNVVGWIWGVTTVSSGVSDWKRV